MLKLKYINSKKIFYSVIILCVLLSSAFYVEAKTGETEQKTQDESPAPDGTKKTEVEERKYIYNPTGKTDPFKSFIAIQEEKKGERDEKPRTYLETLELSQVTITIIIIGETEKWAMVKDNKGDPYVIKEGTPIGINGGFVYKIQPGEVIIREEYRNFVTGKKEFRDVSKKTLSDQL